MERGAGWRGPHLPDRFVPEWPLVLNMSIDPITGQALVEVKNIEDATLISAIVASAPAARGATSVRWRCRAAPEMGGAIAGLTRLLAQTGRTPLSVKAFIDGKALAELRPGPSTMWRAVARTTDDDRFAAA